MNAKTPNRSALILLLWAGVLAAQNPLPTTHLRDLYLRAQELESFNRFDQAVELYQRLSEANPSDLAAYAGVRRCLLQLHRYAQLEQFILQLQKTYRHLQFECDLAELQYLQGEKAPALQRWLAIVDANPLSEEAYQRVGGALEAYELWKEALSVYQQGRKRLKRPQQFAFEISRIRYHERQYEESSEELLAVLKSTPEQFGQVQAQLLNFMSDPPAFMPILHAIEKALKADRSLATAGHQILGAGCTQAKKYDNALQYYIQLETLTRSGEMAALPGHFIFSLATTALNDKAYAEARAAFKRLVEHYPASPYSRRAELSLAEIHEQQKEYPQAIDAYQRFVDRYPRANEALAALMKIGEIQFNSLYDLAAAEQTFLKMANDRSSAGYRFKAWLRLGDVAVAAGNLARAESCYETVGREAPETIPDSKEAHLGLARVEFYRGRPGKAISRLSRLLYGKPMSAPNKTENDALELYLFLTEHRPDSIGVSTLGEAHFLMAQRRYADSVARVSSVSGPLLPAAWLLAVEAYRKLGRPERAVPYCDSLQQNLEAPFADRGLMLAAELYLQDLGDPVQARKKYETVLEKFPQSVYIEEARSRVRELDKKLKP